MIRKNRKTTYIVTPLLILSMMAGVGATISGNVDVRDFLLLVIIVGMTVYIVRETMKKKDGFQTNRLIIVDENENPKLELTVNENGRPVLKIPEGNGEVGSIDFDFEKFTRAGEVYGSGIVFSLNSPAAALKTRVGLSADDEPMVEFYDDENRQRLTMVLGSQGPRINYFDATGRRLWSVPVVS
jgi:hypothetical protein